MKQHFKSERGQALVLIVLAILGLFGMAALAIDGGNAFSDRRHAQNSADTAALAAALAKIRGQDWSTTGLNRASNNGYDNNGTTNIVEVHNPPINGTYAGNNEYIQVVITSHVDTYFGEVIGVDQVTNKVQAVARAIPPTISPLYDGNALVGLAPHLCHAVTVLGTTNTTTINGGVYVNSDCSAAFYNNSAAASLTSLCLQVVGGIHYKPGTLNIPADCILTGVEPNPYPPTNIVLPNISCSHNAVKVGNVLKPGRWSGTFPPSGVDTLESGVFCVQGEFKINGGDSLTGHNVVISMESGGVKWNGGATINLDAPDNGPFKGLLLYMPMTNSSEIEINGNSDSHFTGTFLAPAAPVTILGTGAVDGFNSQIISYSLYLSGTSDCTITYNAEDNFDAGISPVIELTQ
jgi:Flp pilus assembly protein TadG